MVKNVSKEEIEILMKYRPAITYGEIGALIHDLGKLNDHFVKKQSLEGEEDSQLQGYNHGDILEYDSDDHQKYFPADEILKEKAEKLKKTLKNIEVTYNDKSSDLYSFIRDHHKNLSEQNGFIYLLSSSDAFDSEEDRGNASDKQSICRTCYSNAFGFEKELMVDYRTERKAVYDLLLNVVDTCDINKIKLKRRVFLDTLKNTFSRALGMTARAANDVSLWEHSYMTASIFKALLGQSILKNNFPVVKGKAEIENEKSFRILTVGWDFFDFVSQSHAIPDVVGRIKVLEAIKEETKNLIEAELLLGNCIYEDDYGLHFLVPAAFDDKTIIKDQILEIFNEKTNGFLIPHLNLTDDGGKLAELLPNALDNLAKRITEKKIDLVPKWITEWRDSLSRNKLICRVCGKGVYCESDEEEICGTCKDLRDKGREGKTQQTKFIDEIAWNGKDYENVALVVLNFDLENWLNGNFVKSLFMRRYNEEELQKLTYFYNSDFCSDNYDINITFIKDLLNLGALKTWIDGTDRAYNGASSQVKNCMAVFNSSENFVKSELSNIKISLEKVEKELEVRNRNTVSEIFEEELNKDKIAEQLRTKFREIEYSLLGSENLKEKREIVKNSTTGEIREKIFLKNPSPSRLMRVWNNTGEFFEDLSTYLCEKSLSIDRYVLEIGKILDVDRRAWEVEISAKGKRRRGEIVFDGRSGITVTPHINEFIEESRDAQLKITVTDRDWEDAESEFSAKFKEKGTVRGYRTISVSPNMFMFLVPASKVFDCILAIKSRYMEWFGKVYGKLPLNAGVVHFKRKTPFFVVLDSGRRYINSFEVKKELLVKEIKGIERNKILIDVGEIELPCELGNGKRDYYHPYIMVEEGGISLGDITVKHVLSLEKGDKIKIHPSFFDFEYLDTTARRFDIVVGEGKKRAHSIIGNNGPRPYLLEELDKFERLKEIFEVIGSWTPIRDIEALATSKRWEWGDEGELGDKKDVYEELIDSALENKISDSAKKLDDWRETKTFLKRCILEGSFFDAIELFKSIMKMDLGDVGK